MPIKVNGASTGSVTLAAPATGSDVTLTLPTLGFGKVLQVVMGSTNTAVTVSSTTPIDTGLSATITPSATNSKILVCVAQAGCYKDATNAGSAMTVLLFRGASFLCYPVVSGGYTGTTLRNDFGTVSCFYLDSPATTSATTYKTTFNNIANAASVGVQVNNALSTMILVEVAA